MSRPVCSERTSVWWLLLMLTIKTFEDWIIPDGFDMVLMSRVTKWCKQIFAVALGVSTRTGKWRFAHISKKRERWKLAGRFDLPTWTRRATCRNSFTMSCNSDYRNEYKWSWTICSAYLPMWLHLPYCLNDNIATSIPGTHDWISHHPVPMACDVSGFSVRLLSRTCNWIELNGLPPLRNVEWGMS